MPEHRVQVYYEGADDRAVLEGLRGAGLLPNGFNIASRDRNHPGKFGVIDDFLPFVRPVSGVGGNAVVLIDLDELEPDRLEMWLQREVAERLRGSDPEVVLSSVPTGSPRVKVLTLSAGAHTGRAALVCVGLHEDTLHIGRFQCTKFAIDDYALRLACRETVFSAVSEMTSVKHELAMRKLDETAELFRRNELVVDQSKRLLHILHAVTAFRASPATFIERLMQVALDAIGASELRTAFNPLVDDLEEAARLLLHQNHGLANPGAPAVS